MCSGTDVLAFDSIQIVLFPTCGPAISSSVWISAHFALPTGITATSARDSNPSCSGPLGVVNYSHADPLLTFGQLDQTHIGFAVKLYIIKLALKLFDPSAQRLDVFCFGPPHGIVNVRNILTLIEPPTLAASNPVMRQSLSSPRRHHSFLYALIIPAALLAMGASAQSVVINEVSNGPAGNQEFVELVVVPTGPVDPCMPRPCLDLRGWIFDDNNGYHGAGGMAPGAMRFNTHALWSCVPVGTIIAIYNDGDPDPNLPPQDVSLTDGNCSIVVGAGNSTYFEYTPITPSPMLCADPGGWGTDSSPTWMNNMAFANSGDCARVCDPTGCEVFIFCYGSVSLNATIYISGSGGQRVWGFGDGDPYNASNWWYGIANGGSPQQTPGVPNNVANAAWIGQFNDNCTPPSILPLTVSAEATTACGCTATATATAAGSVPGYNFIWYDPGWNNLGQPTAVATALCAGTHQVIALSAAGCSDTATVIIEAMDPPDAGIAGTVMLCANADPVDLFTILNGLPDADGAWTPPLNSSTGLFDPAIDLPGDYTYTVTGQSLCPDASAVVHVNVTPLPVVDVTTIPPSCQDGMDGSILLVLQGAGPFTYAWADGPTDAQRTGLTAGTYTVEMTGPGPCAATVEIPLEAPPSIIVTVETGPATCGLSNGQVCATASGGSGPLLIDWDGPMTLVNGCIQGIPPGNWTVNATDTNGCSAQATAVVHDLPSSTTISVTTSNVSCWGLSDGTLIATVDPPTDDMVTWQQPDGSTAVGNALNNLPAGNYLGSVVDASGCAVSAAAAVGTPEPLQATASTTDESCVDLCDGTAQLTVSGGTAPYTFIHNGVQFPDGHVGGLCAGDQVITVVDMSTCALDVPVPIVSGDPVVAPALRPLPVLCLTDTPVLLSAEPGGGTWSGPGIVDASQGIFDPSQAGAGMAMVTYTLASGCNTLATGSVEVVGIPNASFAVLQDLASPVLVLLTAEQAGADQYAWWLNGMLMATGPQWSFSTPDGSAPDEVCLTVTNGPGCVDSTCRLITAEYASGIFVPNAFTPDDDGINDRFAPLISGTWPQGTELLVFDRWGGLVFDGSAPSGWDGTLHGSPVQQGLYPWRFSYVEPLTGVRRALAGYVTLLR